MYDIKNDRCRKVKTLFNSKRPALRNTRKNQVLEKAPHKGDVHDEQTNSVRKTLYNGRIARKVKDNKCPRCDQKIHRINAGYPVFEVLLEPVFGQLKIIIIPESDQKAG